MECPNCKLLNPDSAMRCDCGYDFATRTMRASYLVKPAKPASNTKWRQYAKACGVALGLQLLLLMMRPPGDDNPSLRSALAYPLAPGLFVGEKLGLGGVDLSYVAVWFVFGLVFNSMLYGAILLMCWRRWARSGESAHG